MRTITGILFSVFILMQPAYSCEIHLGTWVSSKDLTMKYIEENKIVNEKFIEYISQVLGHLTVSYTMKSYTIHESKIMKYTMDGEEYEFQFKEVEIPYKIESCTKNSITMSHIGSFEKPTVTTLYFIDKDTYWSTHEFLNEYHEHFVRASQ